MGVVQRRHNVESAIHHHSERTIRRGTPGEREGVCLSNILIKHFKRVEPSTLQRVLRNGDTLIPHDRFFIDILHEDSEAEQSGNGDGGRRGVEGNVITRLRLIVQRRDHTEGAIRLEREQRGENCVLHVREGSIQQNNGFIKACMLSIVLRNVEVRDAEQVGWKHGRLSEMNRDETRCVQRREAIIHHKHQQRHIPAIRLEQVIIHKSESARQRINNEGTKNDRISNTVLFTSKKRERQRIIPIRIVSKNVSNNRAISSE